jgi:glycosyltransferase involved in cell wall biosynthesis
MGLIAAELPSRGEGRRVSVVIPTLNEAENIPHVLPHIPAEYEVIVVDGRSEDETTAVVESLRPDARIIEQVGSGKGDALACGFAAATGEIIVMFDADGSARVSEIERFIAALEAGAAQLEDQGTPVSGDPQSRPDMRRA